MDKYYTISGSEDYLDEDKLPRLEKENTNLLYAKALLSRKPKHMVPNSSLGVDNNSYKFYIAIDAKQQAYNPTNKNQPTGNFVDRTCKSKYSFVQVNYYVFNKYLKFLTTQNSSWIKEINRDLI